MLIGVTSQGQSTLSTFFRPLNYSSLSLPPQGRQNIVVEYKISKNVFGSENRAKPFKIWKAKICAQTLLKHGNTKMYNSDCAMKENFR